MVADSDRVPMTAAGQLALREELKRLKAVERPRNVLEIEEARGHGDITENAEFHAAKERQAFIEGRIAEIENKLSRAEVVDVSQLSGGKVVFGATVKLLDVDTDEQVVYTIVGEDEADLAQRKISCRSPIARALIGRTSGDEVTVRTPKGERTMEILAVEFV
ncbi:MAG: transcription elongation factor GreA [Deltaproteobacteria bacterium]|nr:transcription elongation factor GreA [Deltaproteobacteria bacterium]